MKTFVTGLAIVACTVVAGCSQQEIPTPIEKVSDVSLGISAKVSSTQTKAVVEGGAIAYAVKDYASQPGMGVVVLNGAGDGFYKTDLAGSHIWFMGDDKGQTWKSISALGTNFAGATEASYELTDAIGTVYAYYPKQAVVTGSTAAALACEAPLKSTGTITVSADETNAEMKFGANGWKANTADAIKKVLAAPEEVDYLYASNTGRNVNSGCVGGGTSEGNAGTTNPGRVITLEMKHALTKVSFLVYNDGTLPGAGSLTAIEIRNVSGKTAFVAPASGATMKLANGAIVATGATGDKITRTITGYTVPKKIGTGGTEDQYNFKETTTVTGPAVARKVSLLVYPLTTIPANEIEVVFTIDGSAYAVNLPNTTAAAWVAGNNYLYTVRASERKLSVTGVSVTDWVTTPGGNIDL
ncbi:MAG: fimbrillin family protein [Tannerellaceae bacterium]